MSEERFYSEETFAREIDLRYEVTALMNNHKEESSGGGELSTRDQILHRNKLQ